MRSRQPLNDNHGHYNTQSRSCGGDNVDETDSRTEAAGRHDSFAGIRLWQSKCSVIESGLNNRAVETAVATRCQARLTGIETVTEDLMEMIMIMIVIVIVIVTVTVTVTVT